MLGGGARFRESEVVLAGVSGCTVEFESCNPVNYHQAISGLAA